VLHHPGRILLVKAAEVSASPRGFGILADIWVGSGGTQNTAALTEFTIFTQLPAELRIKIWKHAAFIQRNIDIWTSDFGEQLHVPTDGIDDPVAWFTLWKYSSRTPPPSILSVCQESRVEGLKHYKLDFATSFSFRDFTFSTTPRIYINFAVDRLCFMESFQGADMWDCADLFNRCLTNGTRYMALNVRYFQGGEPWEVCDYIKPTITRFTDPTTVSLLEEIILVNEFYHRDVKGHLEFKDYSPDVEDDGKLLYEMRKWLVRQCLMLNEKGEGEFRPGPPTIRLKYVEVEGERIHA
jgi:hypothetical protein